jgi:GntR family transcriptional regulator
MATVTGVDLEIDIYGKRAAYLQLADKLRAAIDGGELEPLAPIPSLRELTERTGLAMGTVQKTIRLLEREHYVFSVSGRGTFVSHRGADPA